MRKINVFNFLSLNGFYKDADNGIGWHQHGSEENAFSGDSLQANNILLFGRITYEMMYSFWPTDQAYQMDPRTAEGMNTAEKIVFSRTMKKAEWKNTVVENNAVESIRKLKTTPGKNMTILGSGSIVSQLAEHDLIDEYSLMLDPVAIPAGTAIFQGITREIKLKLNSTHQFKSGVILLNYTRQ